ncbi:hypothetical protein [Nocardia thailandica]|uniref:hypothetical protein n=1 Tax=Nocardia thailandica TaxID=257275 RepID=UPI0002F0734F|nr:hypothetical protein [Nocardia thailandica]
MHHAFRDPGIPDGEKSVYTVRVGDGGPVAELTHIVACERGGYRTALDVRVGGTGPRGPELTMMIEQRFDRRDGHILAEHYRAETRSGRKVVSREEVDFADTVHLQFGAGLAPFPVHIMPVAGGLTLLRGLDFTEGAGRDLDAWLAFSVSWPLVAKVEKRTTVTVPAGELPCWQVRIRPSFAQVNSLVDKIVGGLLPPFLAHFDAAQPHRLVRMSFPTEVSLSAPRAVLELVT